MKIKNKKIISCLTLLTLSLGQGHVSAAVNFGTESIGSDDVKIRKLDKLNSKLNTYSNREIKKYIAKIKDPSAKKSFQEELYILNAINKNLIEEYKYSGDYDYDKYVSGIKNQARNFKQIIKDADNLTKNGINAYLISDEEKKDTEKDIVDMQKYYISIIQEYIKELDTKSDIKETGNGSFEIISDVGKISFNIEKYTNIVSLLTFSSEADYSLSINIDIKKDEKLGIPTDINGTLKFYVNIKNIDNDLYVCLKDYSIDFTSDDIQIKEVIDTYNKMLSPYKGKTIHIKSKDINGGISTDSASALKNIKSVLDILSSKAILTPYKKNSTGYFLTPSANTMNSIAKVFGQKITKDEIISTRKAVAILPISFSKKDGNPKISSEVKDKGNSTSMSIEKKSNDYAFELKSSRLNYGTEENIYVFILKDNYKFDLSNDEGQVSFSLVNKDFHFGVNQYGVDFDITGTASEDSADIKITYNGVDLGYIKAGKDEKGNYTYDFHLRINKFGELNASAPEEIKDKFLEINLKGQYLIEKGVFKIEKPTSFIELEEAAKMNPVYQEQIMAARDSTRINDIYTISSGVEMYFQDYGEYPTNLSKINDYMYSSSVPKDPNDGQTINGCKFGYNYEVKNSTTGIKNAEYRISTCLENKDNYSAKSDGGVDDNKFEIGTNLNLFK